MSETTGQAAVPPQDVELDEWDAARHGLGDVSIDLRTATASAGVVDPLAAMAVDNPVPATTARLQPVAVDAGEDGVSAE